MLATPLNLTNYHYDYLTKAQESSTMSQYGLSSTTGIYYPLSPPYYNAYDYQFLRTEGYSTPATAYDQYLKSNISASKWSNSKQMTETNYHLNYPLFPSPPLSITPPVGEHKTYCDLKVPSKTDLISQRQSVIMKVEDHKIVAINESDMDYEKSASSIGQQQDEFTCRWNNCYE